MHHGQDKKINNLVELLESHAKTVPDKIAFTYLLSGDIEGEKVEITYHELAFCAKEVACEIQKYAKPGDRILILLESSLEFIIGFFGCLYAQTIAVPAYPPVSAELAARIKNIVADANPVAGLTSANILKNIQKLQRVKTSTQNNMLKTGLKLVSKLTKVKLLELSDWQLDELNWIPIEKKNNFFKDAQKFTIPDISGETLAFLQYTSGSTGHPKGVMVTHGNLIHNLTMGTLRAQPHLNENSRFAYWLPLYHDMGLINGVLLPIYNKAFTVFMSPLAFLEKPLRWLQAITFYKATHAGGPNFSFELCAKRVTSEERKKLDLSSLKMFFTAAEPIRLSTIEKFTAKFTECGFHPDAIFPAYGLAEATLTVTSGLPGQGIKYITIDAEHYSDKRIRVHSNEIHNKKVIKLIDVGKPLPQVKLIIVDPETHQQLPEEMIGEIWTASGSVTKGYWKNSTATEQHFNGYTANQKGPFLRTGDLGFIKDGELYIAGRHKDLIIINGRNYYPQDIEHTAERANELIRHGRSVSFAIEENQQEKLIILLEVRDKISKKQAEVIFNGIIHDVLKDHGIKVSAINIFKPRTLRKTTSGKVRRRAMRELYLKNELSPLFSWKDTSEDVTVSKVNINIETNQANAEILQTIINNTINNTLKSPVQQTFATDVPLTDLGLDSLMLGDFVASVNKLLENKVVISFDVLREYQSIKALSRYLEKKLDNEFIKKLPDKLLVSEASDGRFYKSQEQETFMRLESLAAYQKMQLMLNEVNKFKGDSLFFNITDGISTNKITIAGKEYINYSGYNYLGMSGDPVVSQFAIDAIKTYGTSVSASRVVAGEKIINRALEQEIADIMQVDAAVVFTAGHATNIAVITHLFGPEDLILHDELIHNSALQGAIFSGAARFPFLHNDINCLEKLLSEKRPYYKRALIITEGVFSMDGDIPNLPAMMALKKKFHAYLMVDEAHSLGTIGKHGRGISEYFGINAKEIDIWMGTLSKALGSCGGYIAGPNNLIEFIKTTCGGFVFSAGITPANAAAALASIRLLKQQPERVKQLQARSKRLLEQLNSAGIDTGDSKDSPIIPLIMHDTEKTLQLSQRLREHLIYALPIVYPAVEKDKSRVRLFITCLHTDEEIDYTAKIIRESVKGS